MLLGPQWRLGRDARLGDMSWRASCDQALAIADAKGNNLFGAASSGLHSAEFEAAAGRLERPSPR